MLKFCHKDPSRILTLGKTEIWGGSKDGIASRGGWSLVISALGKTTLKRPFEADDKALELLPKELFDWSPPPQVSLEWPDGGVPAISKEWWRELAKALPAIGGKVGCFCMGGHGRTGTMLSILYALTGNGKGDPVKAIRKKYCRHAVETEEQIEYIEDVTGRAVHVAASYVMRPTHGMGQYGGVASAGQAATLPLRRQEIGMPE
jgi:hypothetical protein